MDVVAVIQAAVHSGASDVHLTVGLPPMFRINGRLHPRSEFPVLTARDTELAARQLLTGEKFQDFQRVGHADGAYSLSGIGRFRVNAFLQRGSVAVAVRVLSSHVPRLEELGLPPTVARFAELHKGLVLVTGPTGSGKSTTLAALIEEINNHRSCHVITLEDPIEYLHRHRKSIINQREIGIDVGDFSSGLRAALREDPDVIMVGEMRDLETIATAITAAETGHLVFATLHTSGAAQTVDRIIDVFPPHQQAQIRRQIADTLEGVISQQLVERKDGSGRVPAVEILVATPAVRNLIREGKTYQIPSIIQTGAKFGMQSFDASLKQLYTSGLISRDEVQLRLTDPTQFKDII